MLKFCIRIYLEGEKVIRVIKIQADLRDTAGSVPDHHNKSNTAIKQVTRIFFGFPVHIKAMFTLYCSLLSVQEHYALKKKTFIKKYLIAKQC